MKYRYWLMNVKGISETDKRALSERLGGAREVFFAAEQRIGQIIGAKKAGEVVRQRGAWELDGAYRRFAEAGVTMVTQEDRSYPLLLRRIHQAPYGLYVSGTLPPEDADLTAIVGARRCSPYGRQMAEELAGALAGRGFSVVSGMARGIDGAAHRGCLAGGALTVAVLGCGVDVCYPKEHEKLCRVIRNNGCILSEFPPGTPPLAYHFPQRNRIISGMASRVIVVEAQEKSGSLITAELALEQGRDVYAVPGRVTDPLSAGCNRLIWQGAEPILSVEEFIGGLCGDRGKNAAKEAAKQEKIFLEKEETLVYSCFDLYPKSVDSVCEETGMDLLRLLSVIMDLCDKGFLREYVKNQYVRCR